ncbi:MAG: hypothetical protein GXP31_13890 [Kiritimatiellaeota bacterium]|nr:hypothetical protein [Kiritimatiellota bacterium]
MPATEPSAPVPVRIDRRRRRHRRSRSGWFRGLRVLLLVLFVLVGASAAYIFSGVSRRPGVTARKARVFSAGERTRLAVLYRRCQPDQLGPDKTKMTRLSEHDVNLLLSLFLSESDGPLAVTFVDGWFRARISAPCGGLLRGWWWNLSFLFRPTVAEREVAIEVRDFLVGSRPVPGFVAQWWVERKVDQYMRQGRLDAFFGRVSSLSIDDSRILIRYRRFRLPKTLLCRFLPPAELGTGVPAKETLRLLGVLERHGWESSPEEAVVFLFRRVREATKAGAPPGRENSAALAALALASGNLDLETRLKITVGADVRERIRRYPMIVPLSERRDVWPLLLRAAVLSLLQGEDAAFSAALEQEVRASLTPTGFSYVHLLAALAGSALAESAAAAPQRALKLQERLGAGFAGYAFFPPDLRDVREHISVSDFETRYGGVHGPLHLRILEDLREMVRGCPAYR